MWSEAYSGGSSTPSRNRFTRKHPRFSVRPQSCLAMMPESQGRTKHERDEFNPLDRRGVRYLSQPRSRNLDVPCNLPGCVKYEGVDVVRFQAVRQGPPLHTHEAGG